MGADQPFEFKIRSALRQVLLDLRLAGVTHLPKACFGRKAKDREAAKPEGSVAPTLPVEFRAPPVELRIPEPTGEPRSTTPEDVTTAESTPGVSAGVAVARETGRPTGQSPQASDSLERSRGADRALKSQEREPPAQFASVGEQGGLVTDPGFSILALPVWAQESTVPPLSGEEKRQRLAALEARVAKCTRCPELVANRSRTVFSDGNPDSRLVFIGEAPGAEEDRQGLPFVGRAGQLLTDIITKGMGLRREDVYICNVIKCRPPENRTPTPTEVTNCRDFLDEQLAIIRPEFICCLGSVAAQRILGTKQSMTRLRGKVIRLGRVRVVCTYHPAYLLRNPEAKRETWEDIKLLMREMGLPVPPPRGHQR
jgi:uracil-DNA glycosylase family 4